MPNIQIDVDGLPVDVDSDEYLTDPELVIESVRKARSYVRLVYKHPRLDKWVKPNPHQADSILRDGPSNANLKGWPLR